jgi:hypothetical protein
MAIDRSSVDLAVEQLRPVLVSIAERLHETAGTAAKAMARTALDVLEDGALLERVRAEFVAS